jgi:hypothetical protein
MDKERLQLLLENYTSNPSNIKYAKNKLKLDGNENPTMEDVGYLLTQEFKKKDPDKMGSPFGRLIVKGIDKINNFVNKKDTVSKKNGGIVKKKKVSSSKNTMAKRRNGIAIKGTKFKGIF